MLGFLYYGDSRKQSGITIQTRQVAKVRRGIEWQWISIWRLLRQRQQLNRTQNSEVHLRWHSSTVVGTDQTPYTISRIGHFGYEYHCLWRVYLCSGCRRYGCQTTYSNLYSLAKWQPQTWISTTKHAHNLSPHEQSTKCWQLANYQSVSGYRMVVNIHSTGWNVMIAAGTRVMILFVAI